MSKDIQLGKDQIENYQNGDVDRPYKSKEKEDYKYPSDYARKFLLELNDKNFKDKTFQNYINLGVAGDFAVEIVNVIEQLKAENERLKRGVLEKVELLIKHPKFDDVLYYEGYLPEIALQIKEALNKE